jgi:hypothetical protein
MVRVVLAGCVLLAVLVGSFVYGAVNSLSRQEPLAW